MGGGKKQAKPEMPPVQAPKTPVDIGAIAAQLHPLERKALPHLRDGMLASEIAAAAGMQEVEVARALQWLENKAILSALPVAETIVSCGANGVKAIAHGMPEARFLAAVQAGHMTRDAIIKTAHLDAQEYGASVGVLKKQELIEIDKANNLSLTAKGKKAKAESPETHLLKRIGDGIALNTLTQQEQKSIAELKGRKEYVILRERKDQRISLTDLGKTVAATDLSAFTFSESLTREDLESGAWKDKTYRAFDVSAPVPKTHGGREHFVTEAIEHVRRIWIEMGFTEMEGNMVQTAFWDLDALFVPQDHPARDVQDTFYLEQPRAGEIERDAFARVRDAHENGGTTGSTGWRVKFSKIESEQLLLRTHTTVLSAQTLWAIRQGKAVMPGKYFTVDKVFRNEKLDWKHLFEFHQVEGIVVDPDATFSQLIGYLRIFFAKMGYPKIRLRPHHFPYTEPSVEVDVWHPTRNQWIELGGAGVLRPEVAKTITGEDVPVLAWGLGLERIIVDKFGFTDLRDLYRNDVAQLRGTPHFLHLDAERTDG